MVTLKALLPMKGHSERIPNKNLKSFNGKPLFHCILTKLDVIESIEQIIINTDSGKIAESATGISSKVVIHERPSKLCGDTVPMNDIINYDISNSLGEHYLQTHSTNPLIKPTTLAAAINTYFKKIPEFDSLFTVTKWQTRLYWENGNPINHNPEELVRTQDLPPVFEENSNAYIFSKKSFHNSQNSRIGKKPLMFEIGKIESIDIDEPQDFLIAEKLHNSCEE
ncbi:MAG: acylneuraminate cytidylyltransferase family protein [Bacteroidota bacterium]